MIMISIHKGNMDKGIPNESRTCCKGHIYSSHAGTSFYRYKTRSLSRSLRYFGCISDIDYASKVRLGSKLIDVNRSYNIYRFYFSYIWSNRKEIEKTEKEIKDILE